jgi:Ca2+-binding EF-hand superfamily protein
MSRVLFTLSLVALAWGGAPALYAGAHDSEQAARMRFQSMDRNGDGAISRAEWQGSARSFAVHDWNGDGQLSGDEVRIGGQRTVEQADHDPNRYERNLTWTVQSFTALDHNRDRRISRNEWHFDSETFRRVDVNGDGALSQQEFVEGDADDDRDDPFDDLDANNNGRVERNEWHAGAAAFNRLDRNRDGVLSRFEVVGGQNSVDTYDQFASLDNDNSGTISRNEWHWGLGSFDQRDGNRDGVLTRREFEGIYSGDVERTSGTRTVQVDSQQRWTDAGIAVRRGDVVTFQSSGEISMSDASDVATPAGAKSGRKAPDAPLLNQPAGALIARIGDYGPIFVGGRNTITAPVSGRLFLGVNDDHLPDNRGSYTVVVGVQSPTF